MINRLQGVGKTFSVRKAWFYLTLNTAEPSHQHWSKATELTNTGLPQQMLATSCSTVGWKLYRHLNKQLRRLEVPKPNSSLSQLCVCSGDNSKNCCFTAFLVDLCSMTCKESGVLTLACVLCVLCEASCSLCTSWCVGFRLAQQMKGLRVALMTNLSRVRLFLLLHTSQTRTNTKISTLISSHEYIRRMAIDQIYLYRRVYKPMRMERICNNTHGQYNHTHTPTDMQVHTHTVITCCARSLS